MYKRPSQRVKVHTSHIRGSIPDDTFIGRITKSKPTTQYKFVKGPVYHQNDYLKLLEANYKKMGLPYVDPQLPIIQPKVYPEPPKEPELTFGDRIQVNIRVLKSGIVRVKINSAIAELYAKYYGHAKRPPFKMVLFVSRCSLPLAYMLASFGRCRAYRTRGPFPRYPTFFQTWWASACVRQS